MRPPMHPMGPQHALLIGEYVTVQLDELSQLQQQSRTARAREVQNGMRPPMIFSRRRFRLIDASAIKPLSRATELCTSVGFGPRLVRCSCFKVPTACCGMDY